MNQIDYVAKEKVHEPFEATTEYIIKRMEGLYITAYNKEENSERI